MVVIHIKHGENDGFLYEVPCETSCDEAIREIVRIWNTRIRLAQLCGALPDLAQFGPMKKPDKAGLDTISEKYNGEFIDKNEYYQPDPTGNRTGNGVGPQLTETIDRVVADTQSVLDPVRMFSFSICTCTYDINDILFPKLLSTDLFHIAHHTP